MLVLAFLPFVLLPLIAGVIAIRRAWQMMQGAEQTRTGLWILLTILAALLPLFTHLAAEAIWTFYDCTGGKTFEGCNDTSDALGNLIFSLAWLGVLTLIPALVIGASLALVAMTLFILGLKRQADKVRQQPPVRTRNGA